MQKISKIMAFTTMITLGTAGAAYSQDAIAPDAGHMVAESSHTNDNATADESAYRSASNLDQNQTREIQGKLKEAGYRVSTDGVWGPQTTAAIRSFQDDNDLSKTGQPDTQTLAALGVQFDASR